MEVLRLVLLQSRQHNDDREEEKKKSLSTATRIHEASHARGSSVQTFMLVR